MILRLALVAWLVLCGVANAQLSGGLQFPGPGTAHSSGCSDSDFLAWKATVGAVGATQESATCTLITDLKAHSLWTNRDRIWLPASENTTQARTDLKTATTNLTVVSTVTHTASQGYAGNGSSGYLDTGTAANAFSSYVQNSAAITIYNRTTRAANNSVQAGFYDSASTGTQTLMQTFFAALFVFDINNGATYSTAVNTDAQGQWTITRTGASAEAVYFNAAASAFATAATSSSALPALNFFVDALNQNGTANSFSSDQIAIIAIGAGLSQANAAQLHADFNAYMTTLGTNVY